VNAFEMDDNIIFDMIVYPDAGKLLPILQQMEI
jgi:hypothetical protein